MDKARRLNLPTPLALAVIVAALVACGSDAPSENAAPASGGTQVGSGSPETGTSSSDSEAAEEESADETPTATPVDRAPAAGEPADEAPAVTPVAQAQDSSRMSPGEYLEICGLAERAFEEPLEDPFDLEEIGLRFEDVIDQFESVRPPEEFADWHQAIVTYLNALVEVIDDTSGPGGDASDEEAEDYALRIMGPVAFQHLPRIFEIIEGMDPDYVARMVEAGCVDEEDIGASSVDEESSEPAPEDGDGVAGAVAADFASVSA
ncbi:MAG: hypothetical protein OXL35_06965 [Chloroflexota bacterium]|nr:hypothetical protein [Chloroflexota bacterium]